ncbi:MAG TPA: hypothetical protein VLA13_09735 [Massilibacterium sp.]|nr:hypothetical protein [Massilibacterium sp.]
MKKTSIREFITIALVLLIFLIAIILIVNPKLFNKPITFNTDEFLKEPKLEFKEFIPKFNNSKKINTISYEEFKKVKMGMSVDEVVDIIGGKGKLVSKLGSKKNQPYLLNYSWEGENGDDSYAEFTFINDQLTSKYQFNLQKSNTPITYEQFNQIPLDISYDEVIALLGDEGIIVSENGDYQAITYNWNENNQDSSIDLSFVTNKVVEKSQRNLLKNQQQQKVTLAQFNQIQNGMSLDEVLSIFQTEGVLKSMKKLDNEKSISVQYLWDGEPEFSNILLSFDDNILVTKVQSNLDQAVKPSVTITKKQLNQIKKGMSYDEVIKILGGKGQLISESYQLGDRFYSVTYEWKGKSELSSGQIMFDENNTVQHFFETGLQ